MSEYWGWCEECERPFYLGPAVSEEIPDNASCPVCLSPPTDVTLAARG
jgi:hypothetical protein